MTLNKIIGSAALTAMLLVGCSNDNGETPASATTSSSSNSNLTTSAITVLQSPELASVGNSIATISSISLVSSGATSQNAPTRYTSSQLSSAINESASYDNASHKEKVRALKVDLQINPETIDQDSAKKAVATVAKTLIGKTINGSVVTQNDIDAFMTNIDANGLYFMALMEAYAKEKNINVDTIPTAKQSPSRAAKRGILSKLTSPLTDAIKDGLVKVIGNDAVTDLTADAFRLVLQSKGVTTAMLDMAINSETITDIMVTVMVDNWDLTEAMIPMMLNSENDYEFTRKFLQLAVAHHQQIGTMTFSYIDPALYDTITKVMALSPAVNTAMGETMVLLGVNHFVIPNNDLKVIRKDQPNLYAGVDAFARLMVDSGNGTTNERLFYSLFSKSDTTDSFVKTMQQVKAKDADTATFFMDTIFLGGSIESGAPAISDVDRNQSVQNIYAITKAMLDGYNAEGLAPYSASFVGFAGLIPFDRYLPYAKAMGTAGYYYAISHGYSITGTIGEWVSGKFFPADEPAPAKASLRKANALTDISDWFADLFGSYSTWLADATDFLTTSTVGQTVSAAFDSILGSMKVGVDTAINDLKASGHDYIEAKIQVTVNDVNYTLPPFEDITLDYIIDTSKTTALELLDDPAAMRTFSDANLTQEFYAYVNGKLATNEYLGYIPTWMTQLDWIELPSNIDARPTPVINFSAGSVDVYILSDNANMIDLQTNVLGNQVLLTEVAIGDSPLKVDGEIIEELHVYKFTIYASDLVDINAILAKLGTYLQGEFGAVALDAAEAILPTVTN